jgi:2-polyprenyl-6-methoxyphenol hydroxylase-like FAD-dependent oxidoreductase
MRAEIGSAGFARLTAAIALRRREWGVRVHDKDAALHAFCAGIFIWENGLRGLHAIGAAADVLRSARQAPAQVRAAELARTRAPGSSARWDDSGMRAALHVPTATRPEEYATIRFS